jgi:hypothetical protein
MHVNERLLLTWQRWSNATVRIRRVILMARRRCFDIAASSWSRPGSRSRSSDYGDGHVNLYARRGQPSVLFNCHLDTVPIGPGWTRPPLELTIEGDLAYGRGRLRYQGRGGRVAGRGRVTDAPMALVVLQR